MTLNIDVDRIEEVAARLDLRQPNREALESVVFEQSQWFDNEHRPAPFECVVDSATGVGKTFIIAALVEYSAAASAARNFAVICPNRTILNKTVANFTPGNNKSLIGAMESHPFVVTADNFNTPSARAALDDDSIVKLYIFTVQSLTKPTTKQGRKTHDFQEGLGAGFYEHLAQLDDLFVLADEQHLYWGPAFSRAIADLKPHTVVGLTATPHARTPEEQIVYRYPLAAAIADRWVKTPVIVGRRDDRHDSTTKLLDGVTLLRYKAEIASAHCTENGLPPLHPVMLVIAQDTAEADEYNLILESSDFDAGRWRGTVLTVHSNLSGSDLEDALDQLAAVEDVDSPIRIIVSVGMLKEGWDARNVYVIASMRASVSKVLTEQTLGRGLRLAFGSHTGIEMLDTLEVVAHEKYEDLLRAKGVLNEGFIDQRTRAVLRQNAQGQLVSTRESEDVSVEVIVPSGDDHGTAGLTSSTDNAVDSGGAVVSSLEDRTKQLAAEASDLEMAHQYAPADEYPPIHLPRLRMTRVETPFSLADITDLEPFRGLGRQLAANPEDMLRRTKVSARVVTGRDGLRQTQFVTADAADAITASQLKLPLNLSVQGLLDAVLASPVVPSRPTEAKAAQPLVDAFLDGLGQNAEHFLSAYGDRATARLVRLVTDQHRRHLSAPHFEHVVELTAITDVRESKRKVSLDPHGGFQKAMAYNSRKKSLYGIDWFDSKPERDVANIVDDSPDVLCWVRLLTGDMSVLWRSDGREYNADLIVVEHSADHWVVEVKANRDVTNDEVQAKRTAARRWVNHVNADERVAGTWHYVLVSEADVEDAAGSWAALKKLGS